MTLRRTFYLASILFAAGIANAQLPPAQIIANCPTGPVTAGAPLSVGFTLTGLPPVSQAPILFRWILLNAPPGFAINGATAVITVNGQAPMTPGAYPLG